MAIIISDTAGDIETLKRALAVPGAAREYSMGDSAQPAQIFKLIMGDAIICDLLQYYNSPFPNSIQRPTAFLSLGLKPLSI